MDELPSELDRLCFSVEKSLRYHQRRRAFFETVHRWLMFAIIMLGAAAAASLFGIGAWLALLTTLLAAFDLVWASGTKARDHLLLHQRFATLMADIARVPEPRAGDISYWKARRMEIETDEPPVYWALEKACLNETAYALGLSARDNLPKLSWQERALKNVFRFDRAA